MAISLCFCKGLHFLVRGGIMEKEKVRIPEVLLQWDEYKQKHGLDIQGVERYE